MAWRFKREGAEPAKVRGVKPEILAAIMVCDGVYAELGIPLWEVTEFTGATHGPRSKHYEGEAADLRLPSRYVTKAQVDVVAANMIRARLSAEYDVVLEGNHLHVEFDPKAPRNDDSTGRVA